MGGFVEKVFSVFNYKSNRIAVIHSKKIGCLNRLIQLGVLLYIFIYTVILEKGYQDFDLVVSATSSKVKGTSFEHSASGQNTRIWDTPDYVVPALENNAFFVTTRTLKTLNQSPGICAENEMFNTSANCTSDADCEAGEHVPNGNGAKTGTCNLATLMCNIHAWCPVENRNNPGISSEYFLNNVDNFTVLIKNEVKFPKFGVKRRNIPATMNQTYLKSCRYDKDSEVDQHCPVFKFGDIFNQLGENYTTIYYYGGYILINIYWNCDLDKSVDKCLPKYKFSRLDQSCLVSPGCNFRYANYYSVAGKEYRDLIKAYGIRFIIDVTGQAGKFDFAEFSKTVGSGLAYFGSAVFICDLVTLYICDKKDDPKYDQGINLHIQDNDCCCSRG